MAQKVTVALEDDLDGGPAEETVRFGLDGTDYEIDLSAKNARAFRKKLAPFIEHPRKASRGPTGRTARTSAGRRPGPQVGQRPRRRGQRPRPDPGQRIGAVPGRRYGTLNQPEAGFKYRSPSVIGRGTTVARTADSAWAWRLLGSAVPAERPVLVAS